MYNKENSKIAAIRCLRQFYSLGLREAKEIVESILGLVNLNGGTKRVYLD